MYKQDLALNNLQWLICHKNPTQPTLTALKYKEMLEHNFISNFPLNKREKSISADKIILVGIL